MSKKENIVENQHYIPESLLWHFVNSDDRLFEVFLPKKKIYPTIPGKSMCEKFVYEDDSLETNELEDFFADIEGNASQNVKDIIKTIDSYKEGKKISLK